MLNFERASTLITEDGQEGAAIVFRRDQTVGHREEQMKDGRKRVRQERMKHILDTTPKKT